MERMQAEGADDGEVGAAPDDEGRYVPAWVEEMHRRMDEIVSGTAITISEEELFSRLRERRRARCAPNQDSSQNAD